MKPALLASPNSFFCHRIGQERFEDYFDHAPPGTHLAQSWQDRAVGVLKSTNMDSGAIAYIQPAQGDGPWPRGLVRAPSDR
jgi:hypothetical protein